ncbi:response regulator [Geodermatophilus sp. SYSU D00696]
MTIHTCAGLWRKPCPTRTTSPSSASARTGHRSWRPLRGSAPTSCFMDLPMPVMGGFAATEALRAARSPTRVIVLSGEGSEARSQAGVAGARAVVPKGTRLGPLLHCLRTVAADGTGCPYCL